MNFEPLDLDRLRLPRHFSHFEYLSEIDSTNDDARRRSETLRADETLLVVAEVQTAGRGRGGNRWWTGPGSLAFSLLFDPARYGIETRYGCMVPLAAATAIVEVAASRLVGPPAGIHWPNDVFLGDRKLAGVLVETLADGRQILGIGCNVNNSTAGAPAEVARRATSLADAHGAPLDRTEFFSQLLESLDAALFRLAAERAELARAADDLCLQRDKVLNVQLGVERVTGVCAGIADDGGLKLDTPAGRRTLYSGIVLRDEA